MSPKFVLGFLGVVLFVQCTFSKAVPDVINHGVLEDISKKAVENGTELPPIDFHNREEVLSHISSKFIEFIEEFSRRTINLFHAVIDDLKVEQNQRNVDLSNEVKLLSDFINKLDNVIQSEDMEEKSELFENVANVMHDVLAIDESDAKTEGLKLLINILESPKYKSYDTEGEKLSMELTDALIQILDNYVNAMSPEEKNEHKKLIELLAECKAETDETKMDTLLEDVLSTFNEE